MIKYIPENIYKDAGNKNSVEEILRSVPNTSMHFSNMKTLEDAIEEIREIGETEIADFLAM